MRFELTTFAMARRRSSQLSYTRNSCNAIKTIPREANGAGDQVRTGTPKGWSLSTLTLLCYPRTLRLLSKHGDCIDCRVCVKQILGFLLSRPIWKHNTDSFIAWEIRFLWFPFCYTLDRLANLCKTCHTFLSKKYCKTWINESNKLCMIFWWSRNNCINFLDKRSKMLILEKSLWNRRSCGVEYWAITVGIMDS